MNNEYKKKLAKIILVTVIGIVLLLLVPVLFSNFK